MKAGDYQRLVLCPCLFPRVTDKLTKGKQDQASWCVPFSYYVFSIDKKRDLLEKSSGRTLIENM